MGDIAAVGPTGKGLGMGQDVAIFRSRARPSDKICCIGAGGNDDERYHCARALRAVSAWLQTPWKR